MTQRDSQVPNRLFQAKAIMINLSHESRSFFPKIASTKSRHETLGNVTVPKECVCLVPSAEEWIKAFVEEILQLRKKDLLLRYDPKHKRSEKCARGSELCYIIEQSQSRGAQQEDVNTLGYDMLYGRIRRPKIDTGNLRN
uniref:DUF1758 domain-containing protein n=1 Tax=Steinernema glaseri TaxID=37863 RepID=A0A1I8A7W2_9BILA